MLLSIKNDPSGKISRKGIFYAILAAVLFGINAMLLKMGTNFGLVYSQQFVLSGTVCLWSMIYLPLKEKRFIHLKDFSVRDNLLGILGGILYCAALFFFVKSYQLLPGSVAFTIIQLNAVWTILAGIFLFHEIEFRKNWKRILAGLLCACLGVIMLLFA